MGSQNSSQHRAQSRVTSGGETRDDSAASTAGPSPRLRLSRLSNRLSRTSRRRSSSGNSEDDASSERDNSSPKGSNRSLRFKDVDGPTREGKYNMPAPGALVRQASTVHGEDRVLEAATRLSAAYRGNRARASICVHRFPSVGGDGDGVYRSLDLPLAAEDGFVQAAGHAGMFKRSSESTIIKTATKREQYVYEAVQSTSLQRFLPGYHGCNDSESMCDIILQDLTAGLNRPAVMDIKMGVRTFLESEADNPKLRLDLAEKVRKDDEGLLSAEDLAQGITKLRYMQYRDDTSSSRTLGWRIEGVRQGEETYSVPARKIATREAAVDAMQWFLAGNQEVQVAVLSRLQDLRATLEESDWFAAHEVVASSLLFVYDDDPDENAPPPPPGMPQVRVFMIDFAKTTPLKGVTVSHRAPWLMGNHEDGYLFGLDGLIDVWRGLMGGGDTIGERV